MDSKAAEIAIQDVERELSEMVSEAFDKGIVSGKHLMLTRMFALGRLLIDSGDATPYLTHFISQIAKEEGFDVERRDGHYEVVRTDLERTDQHSGDADLDSGGDAVHEVREADPRG